ncbi:MAG TPA: hypothetical protein VGG88_08785 [Gaiellaceae bacterium]
MRLVALVAVVALFVAAPASASTWPPPVPQTVHSLKIERTHAHSWTRTCMARVQRVKVARWLAPVACEQPPRSQVLIWALFG